MVYGADFGGGEGVGVGGHPGYGGGPGVRVGGHELDAQSALEGITAD